MMAARKGRAPGGTGDTADQKSDDAGDYAARGEKASDARQQFAAFRNQWLDQVAADNDLPPIAFKLAWYLIQDCGRTLKTRGEVYSYRGQDSLAELLGVDARYVRELVSSMKRHRHVWTKRGGKGNPNETHPVLFERNNSSGQESPLTGTPASFDRNSRVVLTGTEVPPIYMEDSDKEIHSSGGGPSARPPSSGASATSSTLDAAGGEAHRLSADAGPCASSKRSKVKIGDVLSPYDQWKDEVAVGCVVTEIVEDGMYATVRMQDGSRRTMCIGDDDGSPVLVAD